MPCPDTIPLAIRTRASTVGIHLNFLAHLLVAGPTDASRIGNLLGDFARGTPASLASHFPPEVVAGIVMHRKLDRFTDDHPAFREARALLAPERRRFAGIIVDIVFDHFLCLRWGQFCDTPLEEFIQDIYACFDRHPAWLGEELTSILPHMKRENWLLSYATIEGIALTLRRTSARSPRITPIARADKDLKTHYPAFDLAFQRFFPDVQEYAAELL